MILYNSYDKQKFSKSTKQHNLPTKNTKNYREILYSHWFIYIHSCSRDSCLVYRLKSIIWVFTLLVNYLPSRYTSYCRHIYAQNSRSTNKFWRQKKYIYILNTLSKIHMTELQYITGGTACMQPWVWSPILQRNSNYNKKNNLVATQYNYFNWLFKNVNYFSLPEFKLIEGYEVTTSPQKPELSPLLNRGIPLS